MSDFWSMLMALMVIVLPLGLAWLLLGWLERKKLPSAAHSSQCRR
jgi:hypothetical protein